MTKESTQMIAQVFISYCSERNYQYKLSEETNNLRLDISNLIQRTIVNIYNTGTVQIQGQQNSLKAEISRLKDHYEENPQSFLGLEVKKVKACSQRYDIMLPEFRTQVKESLDNLTDASIEITNNPTTAIIYRAKITRGSLSLTVQQYSNGTLLLQGKTDALFEECCDLIDKTNTPSEKEVISRFFSSDEKSLEIITAKYTQQLIELATAAVRDKLGDVFEYLEPYDHKYFIASECLCLTEIPLPEFSPLVMPASKAFEGFSKKLLIGIGLFRQDHFNTRTANFSLLNDHTNPQRKAICAREKYIDSFLKRISVCLDMNRNFMLHSDESEVNKLDSLAEAKEKLECIYKDTKEIFDYFNLIFILIPQ